MTDGMLVRGFYHPGAVLPTDGQCYRCYGKPVVTVELVHRDYGEDEQGIMATVSETWHSCAPCVKYVPVPDEWQRLQLYPFGKQGASAHNNEW